MGAENAPVSAERKIEKIAKRINSVLQTCTFVHETFAMLFKQFNLLGLESNISGVLTTKYDLRFPRDARCEHSNTVTRSRMFFFFLMCRVGPRPTDWAISLVNPDIGTTVIRVTVR